MAGSGSAPQTAKNPLSRRDRRVASGDHGRRLNALPFLLAAPLLVLLIIGLLWLFVWSDDDAAEEASWEWVEEPVDGVHAREVPPQDWEAGWCLSGYVDEETPADVVDCEDTYDRQVLLRRNISDGPYPGDSSVADTAHQWCHDDLDLNTETLAQVDHELEIQLWHPTESTWKSDYDRMVSCFLVRAGGAGLSGDFLPAEDGEQSDEESVSPEDAEDLEVDEQPDSGD